MNNKAYEYAKKSIKSKDVPKYVKKQCKEFIKIADGKSDKYYLDEDKGNLVVFNDKQYSLFPYLDELINNNINNF